jgi:hypothetical protein
VRDDRFSEFFLDQADLPGMRRVQDSRRGEPDPGDDSFAAHGGTNTGLAAWMGGPRELVWRLVDIRVAFAAPEAARAYHRERLTASAEGLLPMPDATPVGAGCVVVGATVPVPGLTDILMTSCAYLFTVRNVVVKLFVTQSVDLAPGTLTPAHLTDLAAAALGRIDRALGR